MKDQGAILIRWKECLIDLLNPVDVALTEIHEEQVEEDIQIIEANGNAFSNQ